MSDEKVAYHESGDVSDIEAKRPADHVEHSYDLDKSAKLVDYKADAIEAENEEFRMGVLEAVRAYPMASFWAFIMSCTIVSTQSSQTSYLLLLWFIRWN